MPRDPLLPETTVTVRPHSPDADGGSERKRRRKVLSCYDCRRRKLQCDRAIPACGRCTKAGQATSCIYVDEATDSTIRDPKATSQPSTAASRAPFDATLARPIDSAPPAGDLLSRLEFQDRRIKELEAALTQVSHGHPPQQSRTQILPPTPESITAAENTITNTNVTDRETMLLRGKSFKTQFHGISHPGSLLAYIPELGNFTKEVFERYPVLARTRKDLKALEHLVEYADSRHQITTDIDLKALLPPQAEADELVQLYLDNYDSIYHIIHLPSFRQEYQDMWMDVSNARAHFVALVLLMMATGQCLQTPEPWLYTGNSSVARERALSVIGACEGWLTPQSQKHVTITDFQIRFLLNLARLVNASKFKRTWTDAGSFLRFSMAAGLHRNPESLRKPTSAMDKEMRRRIWFAAAEFELHTAFNRGMISTPWLQQSDYTPPTNVPDEVFDQDSLQISSSKALQEFTGISYLVMANESFVLRYNLNTILNNVRQTMFFEDIKRYTEEIETHIQAIPPWSGVQGGIARAMLATTLYQYMLVLHDRQIRQGVSQSEKNFSKLTIVETAKKIMDTHKSLLDKGSRVLHFLCHDQMRAALSIFHVLVTPDPWADSVLNDVVDQTAIRTVNDAIDLITDKIHRLGREQRQLWMVLAANAFMKTKKDPDQKYVYMQEAVDRIMRPYYRIIASQDQENAQSVTSSSGPPTGRAEMPNGMIEYLPTEGQNKPNEFEADPTLLDFDALSAWTFDDWNFNPADFATFGDL